MKEEKAKTKERKESKLVRARGRTFEGKVVKKFPKRAVIEFERTIYVRKYERYKKSRTKIHARLPENMADKINIGDLIKVQECRPLSKIIHFIVIEKVEKIKIKAQESKIPGAIKSKEDFKEKKEWIEL